MSSLSPLSHLAKWRANRPSSYVVLTASSTFFLAFWHGLRVSSFRKAAHIGYPQPYATEEQISAASDEKKKKDLYLFNCAQRAHGNFLENQPSVLAAMLVAGLEYPIATAVMGAGWSIFRIVYAVGYTSKTQTNGKGRLAGSFFWLFQLGLFGMAGWTGAKMLM